jgi:hypothetical protein
VFSRKDRISSKALRLGILAPVESKELGEHELGARDADLLRWRRGRGCGAGRGRWGGWRGRRGSLWDSLLIADEVRDVDRRVKPGGSATSDINEPPVGVPA